LRQKYNAKNHCHKGAKTPRTKYKEYRENNDVIALLFSFLTWSLYFVPLRLYGKKPELFLPNSVCIKLTFFELKLLLL